MKNLLQKSLTQLTRFAFIVFALSIPTYFLLVDWIWHKELDENNRLIAQRIENEFNEQRISNEKLTESIKFWNEIQPVSKIEYLPAPLLQNQVYTIKRANPYSKKRAIDRFRGLKTTIKINDHHYALIVETNVEETEETVAYIAAVTLVFFLILVIGFWILNRRLSKKLWQPFRDTLHQLKAFQLNSQQQIIFQKTDTVEFEELNAALNKLLQHSIATFKNQKEFTENASHELQTPLAILKNKLDLFMQSDDLTEAQYQIAEDMNKALMRSSRINKGLLLLAKIDNHQFDDIQLIHMSQLTQQCVDQLSEHAGHKQIVIQTAIGDNIFTEGNKTLTELLLNNLLLNAIRHNVQNGYIRISLTQNRLEVANSGTSAINEQVLFKRFAKSSNKTSGSGLGLALIKQICNRHQWQIYYHFSDNTHHFTVKC